MPILSTLRSHTIIEIGDVVSNPASALLALKANAPSIVNSTVNNERYGSGTSASGVMTYGYPDPVLEPIFCEPSPVALFLATAPISCSLTSNVVVTTPSTTSHFGHYAPTIEIGYDEERLEEDLSIILHLLNSRRESDYGNRATYFSK